MPPFDLSNAKAIKDIISQIEDRKLFIEKQLIEVDNISKEDRIKLRGELTGLSFALETINVHN